MVARRFSFHWVSYYRKFTQAVTVIQVSLYYKEFAKARWLPTKKSNQWRPHILALSKCHTMSNTGKCILINYTCIQIAITGMIDLLMMSKCIVLYS